MGNIGTRGHPSRRAQKRAPQDEAWDIFTLPQHDVLYARGEGAATPRVSNHEAVQCAIVIRPNLKGADSAQKTGPIGSCFLVIRWRATSIVAAIEAVVMMMVVVMVPVAARHDDDAGCVIVTVAPAILAMVMVVMMMVVMVIELSKLDIIVR
jgi:hypothetical protein